MAAELHIVMMTFWEKPYYNDITITRMGKLVITSKVKVNLHVFLHAVYV